MHPNHGSPVGNGNRCGALLALLVMSASCSKLFPHRHRGQGGDDGSEEPQTPRLTAPSVPQGSMVSPWSYGEFALIAASPPPAPTIYNPGEKSWVRTRSPVLSVRPLPTLAGEPLTYEFELYSDRDREHLLAQSNSPAPATDFVVAIALEDRTRYFWRARALRGDVAGQWTDLSEFGVQTVADNQTPELSLEQPSGSTAVVDNLVIRWRDEDGDSAARISLFYASSPDGSTGATLIAAQISEDLENYGDAFVWDLADVPPGTYFLYGNIEDESHQVKSQVVGPVRVVPYQDYLSYCLSAESSPSIRRTVNALKARAGFSDCINSADVLATMTQLDLASLDLNDVSPLFGLTRLRDLNLARNLVDDIGPLRGLGSLASLDVSSNLIDDVSALGHTVTLLSLNLSGNPVTTVTPLGGLPDLNLLALDAEGLPRTEAACPRSSLSPGLNRFCARHLD